MITKIKNNDMTEVKTKALALVDFSATWCGPCRMLEPVLEELSEEMAGKVDFFNADSDENMDLAMAYRIASIPALLLLKNGEEVARTVGFQPKESLKKFIEENEKA